MDIVIYTNPDILAHKREKDMNCFWDMSRSPRKFEEGERIYFAIKGKVRGYFVCDIITDEPCEIEWKSNSWVDMTELIECKPFRGFRYKWW